VKDPIALAQRGAERVRAFFGKKPLDGELDAEVASHLEFAIDDNIKRGMTAEEARRAALVRFGGVMQAKEQHRETRGLPWLDVLMQDLRYTLRTLLKDRGFTIIAVLILALGIGANVAVFSVVNTLLLLPLPFHDPQRLVWVAANNGLGALSDSTYRVDAYEEFKRDSRSFEDVTAFVPFYATSETKLVGRGDPKPVAGVWVAGNFFSMLGIHPVLGRSFAPEECVKGRRNVVLLSYPFWQRQFAGDPSIVGKPIMLDRDPATVIGVLPALFDFGSVFAPGTKMDIFSPAIMDGGIRYWGHMLAVIGRLKPGATIAQAQVETNTFFPRLKASHPEWETDADTTLSSLKDYISGRLRRSLIALWCAVGLILLIVCVNLSNLLLARTAARSKEFAMRRALGASRGRLIRQLLTESAILCGAGSVLGLGVAFAVVSWLAHQGSIALPLLSSVRVDGTALGWTFAIAAAVAALFGIAPALHLSGNNLQESIKDTGHGMSDGRKHERMRAALVISEVALSCVLLVGAGLLLRSFLRVLDVDPGFRPDHAAAISVEINDGGNAARRGVVAQEMLQKVSALPGVEEAGISDMLPLGHNRSWELRAKGHVYPKGTNVDAFVYIVTPGYFKAMGMRLLQGRDFKWDDKADSQPVIIINEAAARREWPGENPVGRVAQGIGYNDTHVVGVIADVHETSIEGSANPEVFVPITQGNPEGAELIVRSKIQSETLASSVMATLRAMNPGQPATEFRPIQTLVDHAVSPRRFFVMLVGVFAGLGLVLASLGIYGVISYSVSQRTQEIGIRMALGATQRRVRLAVIVRALQLALLGIAAGTVASLLLARGIGSLLYGTSTFDLMTYAAMISLLIAVALLAGYLPARRASRIHPVIALRGN
jgi:predicted permease